MQRWDRSRVVPRSPSSGITDLDRTRVDVLADLADIGVSLRPFQAASDPLLHDFGHQRMQTERGRDHEGDFGVFRSGLPSQCGNVFAPMLSREQKIGVQDHHFRAASDTMIEGGRNRRFGQFHMSGLDDRITTALLEHLHHIQQHLVGFRTTRPVVDHDHADSIRSRQVHVTPLSIVGGLAADGHPLVMWLWPWTLSRLGKRNYSAKPPNSGVDR